MKEKRKLERFRMGLPAEIEVTNESGGQKQSGNFLTRDISAAGAFISNADSLTEGTPVKIEIILDLEKLTNVVRGRSAIKVTGTVARKEGSGIAIRFDKGYKIVPLSEPKTTRETSTSRIFPDSNDD